MKKIRCLKAKTNLPELGGMIFKKKFRIIGLTIFFIAISHIQVMAQRPATGKVVDSDGPLIGATVRVAGTNSSTVTDKEGKFSIVAQDNKSILVFSYAGHSPKEVAIGNQSVVDVTLAKIDKALDEVVIVGYTTRKRGELTGAVSSLPPEDLGQAADVNLTKSLAGRIPGLIVIDNGGYPGADGGNASTLLIRGQSTLGNNSPLIVVDGVPKNSFSYLAPSDIASFSVLKDAAAAIYGARAANGVILITTRRGKNGKPVVNFNTTNSFNSFTTVPKMMNSYQYATYKNEVNARYGNPLTYSDQDIANFKAGTDPINYPNTNWMDLTLRKQAFTTRNSLSVSGGSDAVKYFVSGNYFNQGGQFASGDLSFEQYQFRSNLDIKINKYVKLGVGLSGIRENRNGPGVDESYIFKILQVSLPTAVGQYPNGLYGVGGENGTNSRVMASNQSGFLHAKNNQIQSQFTLDIDLGWLTKGLTFKANTNFNLYNIDTTLFHNTWKVNNYDQTSKQYLPVSGFNFNSGNFLSVEDAYYKFNENYYNLQLSYDRTFGPHTIRGFAATEETIGNSRWFQAYKQNLISATLPELFAGSADGQTSTGASTEWSRLNYFGSLSYDYMKKYLVDFTLRRDGSSNFAPGKRFGTFPSVAVAWVITDEDFMKNIRGNWLDNLKLRASWAKMGNDNIAPYQYLTQYIYGNGSAGNQNYYFFGNPSSQVNTFFNSNTPNPDITWEIAYNKNIGIDFSLFNSKISGSFNYFNQKRSNILVTATASVPAYTALQLPQQNIGKVDNQGFEFELNYKNSVGKLTYNLGANFTLAKNKVIYIDEAAGVPSYLKQQGHPMNSYLIYPSEGLFKSQKDVDTTVAKLPGTMPGDVKYKDTNGDGKINANDEIRKYTSAVPTIQYGIYGGVSYKGFDLDFLVQGAAGSETEVRYDNEGNRPAFEFNDRWTPTNVNAKYPRAFALNDTYNSMLSNIWLRNSSYVRLKSLEIAYTVPKSVVKFAEIRVFVKGTNLITISQMKDFDPEISDYYNFTSGFYYPLKSFAVGANIKF